MAALAEIEPVPQTERLILRNLLLDDLDEMAAMLGDPEVMRHYPRPFKRHDAREWILRNLDRYGREGYGLWAVVRKGDGAFLGDCGLTVQEVEGTNEVEVGYHLHKAHWGNGYATEAAAACRDHALRLGIRRLIALIRPANVPSQRVATRIGMRPERRALYKGLQHIVFALDDGALKPRDLRS